VQEPALAADQKPAQHSQQVEDPDSENDPAVHALHVEMLVAPVAEEKVPAVQEVQEPTPVPCPLWVS